MARIPMTNGFTVIPEGTHIFRIYNVEYEPRFGKVVVNMITASGLTHFEKFNLMNNDGSMNDKACSRFSIFAKNALNKFDIEEIDHADLLNHYIKTEVTHSIVDSTKEEGKKLTFVNIGQFAPATEFEEKPCEKALTIGAKPTQTEQPAAQPNKGVDLASLLG